MHFEFVDGLKVEIVYSVFSLFLMCFYAYDKHFISKFLFFFLQDLEEEAPPIKKSKLESSSQDFEES